MNAWTAVDRCRCCGSAHLDDVLDLGDQPLANSYTTEPTALPTFPLTLQACADCGHGQLSIVVPPDLMFRHYLYVSGTSRTFRRHFADLAAEALQWIPPCTAPRVLDLACNDGTFLEACRVLGCHVQGVDPAANLVALAREKELAVVEGYWPEVRLEVPGRFDLVTATNVFAHVADPAAFLDASLDVLTPGGAVVIEVPYARNLLLKGEWDTIYHEHLSYFLLGPLLRLAERCGAAVTRVRQVASHGGSLRIAIQRSTATHCAAACQLAQAETDGGLTSLKTYRRLATHVDAVCDDLQRSAEQLLQQGYRLIGYGASAKGNTLLNRCPLPLHYIVDDNPLKHGYLTPGCQIPIHPPAKAVAEPPGLAVLLLAWNFAREIQQNWLTWRPDCRDSFLYYVPKVACHAADAPVPFLE